MAERFAVLTIGDELLNGELADSNTALIGKILGAHGYLLRDSLTVGDVEADIEEGLLYLASRRDVIVVSGGLGPTADDLTARAAAHTFQRRLTLNEEARQQIRDHFARLGQEMHPRNEKQALLPQKVTVLPNPRGTAPGFLLHHNGKDLFFLPGVPDELQAMLEGSVIPHLRERSGGRFPVEQKSLKVFGLSEPKTEALLAEATLPEGVRLAFGVEFPLVEVKLKASGTDAAALLDRAARIARKALGEFVVAVGNETLAGNVSRQLTGAGLTLALAESCTGGMIASMLTEIPGASAFLERAAVTYADSAKADWLGVPERTLAEQGAVSAATALAMARGIRRAAGTDLGVAVTGIAGPEGGTAQKPVGTVFIALAAAGQEQAKGYRFPGDRSQVRRLAAFMALEWLRRYLAEPTAGAD